MEGESRLNTAEDEWWWSGVQKKLGQPRLLLGGVNRVGAHAHKHNDSGRISTWECKKPWQKHTFTKRIQSDKKLYMFSNRSTGKVKTLGLTEHHEQLDVNYLTKRCITKKYLKSQSMFRPSNQKVFELNNEFSSVPCSSKTSKLGNKKKSAAIHIFAFNSTSLFRNSILYLSSSHKIYHKDKW